MFRSKALPSSLLALAGVVCCREALSSQQVHLYQANKYQGQSDPVYQGWSPTAIEGTPSQNYIVKGPTEPYYAWRVKDSNSSPTAANAAYSATVSTYPLWDPAQGWRLTSIARYVTAAGQTPNVGMTAFVNDREYNLLLNLNAAGALQAKLHDEVPVTLALPFAVGAARDYHQFEFRSVLGTAFVDLYVDNTLVNTTYQWNGVSNTTHAGAATMHWGNSSRALTALGEIHVYKVEVLVGPFTASVLEGDFNEDTIVNGADLVNWKSNVGRTGDANHLHGDADADFDVDGSDFLTWQRQVGMESTATMPVPEPESVAITVIVVALWCGRCCIGAVRERRGAA